jgi:anthranilate phosphoribosyltransferase
MSVSTDLRPAIRKLVARANLSDDEIGLVFDAILNGTSSETSVSAFLVALAMKGETAGEIRAILATIRKHAIHITPNVKGPLIDTCGTGGDSIRSFNISTAAAVVASSAGAKIAKHGNRSVSGICGSADFLEEIGFDLNSPPEKTRSCIENVGIGFLYAPIFHPSMKNAASSRKAIGIRTVFNIVGPLSNPCTNIWGQVIGVYEPALMEIFSEVCQGHVKEAMIVHAADGFDELSNTCENDVLWTASNGRTKRLRLHPQVLGMPVAKPEKLVVSSRDESISATLQTIYGKAPREKEDIVVINASAALVLGKVARDFKEGVAVARDSIKTGKAREKLSQMIRYSGDETKLKEAEKKFL